MKVLLTGAFSYTEKQIEYISSLGYEVMFVQDERLPIEADVSDVDAVVCNGLFLYTEIERFSNLKFIQLTSAGLDRVPLDYINSHGIKISNARGVYSAPMAEFALCGVLQLLKQSRYFYNNQKKHIWEKHRGLAELTGKRVLIVGAGSIGREVAKRFRAFDAEIIGIDIYAEELPDFDAVYSVDRLEEQLVTADVVVLTLPLTDENEGFFDESEFALMKSDAVFVNIARGRLVKQSDMIAALRENKIGGAVLDVFEEEPLDGDNELWDMENVILTPHNSFVSDKNNERMFKIISESLKELI